MGSQDIDRIAELEAVIADVVLAAVLHPVDERYEVVSREILDRARFMIDDGDVAAAAKRARSNKKDGKDTPDHG